jgi:hypothetical protein
MGGVLDWEGRALATRPGTLLRQLEKIRDSYGDGSSARKQTLVRQLARRRLAKAEQVQRLHECLCFLRAYPDDAELLAAVEEALARFERRADVRELRDDLGETGIAGTDVWLRFPWFTSCWMEERWPGSLSVDWEDFDTEQRLTDLLPVLMPYVDTPALDGIDRSTRDWVELFKRRDETDAAFLIRRFKELPGDDFTREARFEEVQIPLRLSPGKGSPSRTRARLDGQPIHFQGTPLDGKRPDLDVAATIAPRAVRRLTREQGQAVIDVVREAMVTRHRDLYTFSHADADDVSLVDCGDGLQFACIGTRVERRLLLEAVYGFLTLKNGVPIGYVLASSLFGSTEVAYNVFETFRGGEAGRVFGKLMAMVRHLFGSDACSIDPYQLGHGNEEGLASGAWWFYYKLGFRPLDPDVRRLARREVAKMRKDRTYRSDRATLEELCPAYMFWFAEDEREDVLGHLNLGLIGDRVSRYLGERFGSGREEGLRTCSREAARLLGVRVPTKPGERLAWERWAPLVLVLPGVSRWSPENRKGLAGVIRAKGGAREIEFVRRANAHPLLHRALAKLARD